MRWNKYNVVIIIFITLAVIFPSTLGDNGQNYIKSVEFSPDGNMIAAGIDNGTAFVYKYNETSNNFEMYRWLALREGAIESPYVSWNDRGELALGNAGRLKIWDVINQELLYNDTYPHVSALLPIHWSPGGNDIAFISMNTTALPGGYFTPFYTHINIMNLSTNDIQQFEIAKNKNGYNISGYAWSPDGDNIAYTNSHSEAVGSEVNNTGVRIINVKSGNITQYMDLKLKPAGPLAWQPKGSVIAVSTDDNILFIDALTFQVIKSYEHQNSEWAGSLDWSPDGTKLAIDTNNDSLIVLDYMTLEIIWQSEDIDSNPLDWSPDGSRIVTATTWDSELRIWDADTGELLQTIEVPGKHGSLPSINVYLIIVTFSMTAIIFRRIKK